MKAQPYTIVVNADIRDPEPTHGEYRILMILRSYAARRADGPGDATGTAWPSQARLASEAGIGVRQCQRYLWRLVERGSIAISSNPYSKAGGNRYHLLLTPNDSDDTAQCQKSHSPVTPMTLTSDSSDIQEVPLENQQLEHEDQPEPTRTSQPGPNNDQAAAEIWRATLATIKMQQPRADLGTITEARLVGIAGGVATIAAPSKWHAQELQRHLTTIQAALASNGHPLTPRIVIEESER
jgi:hypothetical protein